MPHDGEGKPAPRVCSTCIFWDQTTKNQNEYLSGPYSQNKEFACRLLPAIVFKTADEWCGQHEAA